MSSSLKLVSLNIQGDRHLQRFLPYMQSLSPDVACLQEVPESLFIQIKNELSATGHFVAMAKHGKEKSILGLAIFVLHKLQFVYEDIQYHYEETPFGEALPLALSKNQHTMHRFVQYVKVRKEGVTYPVGHTHFTWTPDGYPSAEQFAQMPIVKRIIQEHQLIFTGDLNAPRELDGRKGVIWHMLADVFWDNIPQHVRSTLDPELHRKKGLERVVDCLFTPPKFVAEVNVLSGFSDHQLIAAVVSPVS